MKTSQIMNRSLEGHSIRQNHHTRYFALNDLAKMGAQIRSAKNLPIKKHSDYFQTQETKEFLQALAMEEGCTVAELKIATRGRGATTWVHPLVFLDIALWYDARLKVKVYRWLSDNLLLFRDSSGDSFKTMMGALTANFNFKTADYPRVANIIANACGRCERGQQRWNNASESQLEMRDKIQNNIALLADMSQDINVVIQKSIKKAKGDN